MAKRIELCESGVLFNEERHEYWLNGKQLSGITGLIQRQLFPDEYDGIPAYVLNQAAEYGTSVHERCELFDRDWINDGTQEVLDYIQICKENGLVHEASEYTATDGENYASRVDKIYRTSDNTFSIGDIKTYYGKLSGEKLEKCRWQLSIYAYFLELMNKKAKVDRLFVVHLRNKQKKDGTYDHAKEIIFVDRIPSEICKELLECDLRGEQFVNPYNVPEEITSQEELIRQLLLQKATIEEQLATIKADILSKMAQQNAKTWTTETGLRLTRKLSSTRTSLDTKLLKESNPELDLTPYMKTTPVAESLVIAV